MARVKADLAKRSFSGLKFADKQRWGSEWNT